MKDKVLKFEVQELKTRLDKFLAGQCLAISRSKIQRDIELGQAKVNGQAVDSAKFVVRLGDRVEYVESIEKKAEAKNIPLKTLYNNHGLLVIDKPWGLAVHPGAGLKGDSLAQGLLYHFKNIHLVGEEGRNGIVHRLDKDTSGVMLVALTQEMYEFLKNAFAERKIKKEYIALVYGKIGKSHEVIDTALGKSKTDFRKYTTKKDDMVLAKPSVTEYWALEALSDGVDDYTLIRVKLHTGRTHQIRVHLSSIGHPLVGDQLYGRKKGKIKELERQFLHSRKIGVQLKDKSWVEAESPLPSDLRSVLKSLNSKIVNQL